ncbi:MAG: alpha/beta hydrolase [Candidatus Pacebacteria bacterium]|nr:alpha/beta hydrolase [Candidatus Paceibacterota bacterium]
MEPTILYIFGLFEDAHNQLFCSLESRIKQKGYICRGIELYSESQFGSYSFPQEIRQIQDIVDKRKPAMIIAHSLGSYIAMQLNFTYPLLLLDPSLTIAEIMEPNIREKNNISVYDDGEQCIVLSKEFTSSIAKVPSVEMVCQNSQTKDICIVGAGHGGHIVAEQYAACLPTAHYFFLPNANHDFSDKNDVKEIFKIIKSGLELFQAA